MAIELLKADNVITVEMGDCVLLEGESGEYLETYGLGPCVGVAVVIKTIDGKIHRLLGHIIMEEKDSLSFNELIICLRTMKMNTNGNVGKIKISFTTSQSYRDRSCLTPDETKLLKIINNEFGKIEIEFNYSKQVQVSPDGSISTDFENNIFKARVVR